MGDRQTQQVARLARCSPGHSDDEPSDRHCPHAEEAPQSIFISVRAKRPAAAFVLINA